MTRNVLCLHYYDVNCPNGCQTSAFIPLGQGSRLNFGRGETRSFKVSSLFPLGRGGVSGSGVARVGSSEERAFDLADRFRSRKCAVAHVVAHSHLSTGG